MKLAHVLFNKIMRSEKADVKGRGPKSARKSPHSQGRDDPQKQLQEMLKAFEERRRERENKF